MVGEAYVDAIIGKPFRWTSAGGLINMGTFGGSRGNAKGISADGSVIVGYADQAGDIIYRAFRWTQAGGMVDLGTLGGTWSKALDVSADGTIVVGLSSTGAQQHAFRWTQGGGMVDLNTLGGSFSSALAISGDGTAITGTAQIAGNAAQYAYRWTQGGGMVSLGALGGTVSAGYDISSDGSVIVGYAGIAGDAAHHPFRWTQAGGMVDLGNLGGTWGYANAVSADGSIVVGHSFTAGNSDFHAFRWTEAEGIEDLNTLLSDAGVDMTGITLSQANGISPNGKYIVGEGAFPGYATEAFVVYYDGVTGDVTTSSQQQDAAQNLATNQQTMLAESRSTAGQLLGFSRPIDSRTYTYAGGMFGSAVGYTGGQFSGKGVTLLGGIGYGAQDYKNIEQDSAPTVAMAGRYAFGDTFAGQKNLSPFVELGGWITPR
ncbi:MAG TPA: hypothetical protein DCY07_05805, partial [Rhodospirillaceae bacterium]|nr:hypothetical protein [Rhodospirillaceae bacterium]